MSKKVINWGVIGTGKAAHNFAKALTITKHGKLIAIGSRDKEKAKKFAQEFDLSLNFSSYLQLANNSEVDIVYIATPNSCHKENALLCLNSGKNVLIEKPFTTNVQDTKTLIDLAIKNNLFLMEAIWTRFIPAFNKIEQLINSGEIGEIKAFQATLGQPSIINQDSNLFNNAMGGGSLLDLGVYLIFWSQFFFGSPTRVQSNLYRGNTDVDITASILLNYNQGRHANISSSIVTRFANNGVIYGTKGAIEIHQPLYCPTAISIIKYKETGVSTKNKKYFLSKIFDKVKNFPILQNLYVNYPLLGQYILKNRRKATIYFPIKGNGLQYMTEEVSNYLINQPKDSKIIPLTITMSVLETMHKARSELGIN